MALALPPLPPVALPLQALVLPPCASASLPQPNESAPAFPLKYWVLPVSALPPLPPVASALPPVAWLSPWLTVDSFSCSELEPPFGQPLWQPSGGPLGQLLLQPSQEELPEPELEFSWPTWASLEAFALPPWALALPPLPPRASPLRAVVLPPCASAWL